MRRFLSMTVLLGCLTLGAPVSQVPTNYWRGLIVYTNATDSLWHHNWYQEHFLPAIDGVNDIYAASGMDARAKIAAVRWDTTYTSSDWASATMDAYTGTGLMRWVNLLNDYAADFLILVHAVPSSGGVAGAAVIGPPSTWASFWTHNFGAYVWAHEAGHVHGLGHCDGLRQTYDLSGNYVDSAASYGFYTTMEYRGNSGCPNNGDPDLLDTAHMKFTGKFSSPLLTWTHPGTWNIHVIGDTAYNSVALHDLTDHTIRALFNTPDSLILDTNHSLSVWDYSDFITTGRVRIQPGFRFTDEAKMNISVGPHVMAKRGDNARFLREKNGTPEVSEAFSARYNKAARILELSLEFPEDRNVSVDLFDVRGVHRQGLARFRSGGKRVSKRIPIQAPAGKYFVRVQAGEEKLYRSFSIH